MFGKIVDKEFNKLDKIDKKSRFFFVISLTEKKSTATNNFREQLANNLQIICD